MLVVNLYNLSDEVFTTGKSLANKAITSQTKNKAG